MPIRSYFVQYRFILPDTVKHSSYTYQKLFRAIYGYTQAVYKSNGKTYHYHRPGVLSSFPYLRPGKNCVIVPVASFQPLQEFFKTGRNPTHSWETKGEWKCTYFLNEKDVSEKEVAQAVENLISRRFVDSSEGPAGLFAQMRKSKEKTFAQDYREKLAKEAQQVVELEWFKHAYQQSAALQEFFDLYKSLKQPQAPAQQPSHNQTQSSGPPNLPA